MEADKHHSDGNLKRGALAILSECLPLAIARKCADLTDVDLLRQMGLLPFYTRWLMRSCEVRSYQVKPDVLSVNISPRRLHRLSSTNNNPRLRI